MVFDPWQGVAVALVTLFDADREVDEAATARFAAELVSRGVRAVLVGGSTGESDALTDAELAGLVAAVRAACPGVPVLAGAAGQWHRPAVARAVAAVKAGADAVLVPPPRRAAADLAAFYGAVADAVQPAGVLAYHYPGVAGGEVPLDALAGLPVHGMKDSTGSADRLLAELAAWERPTWVGSTALVAYAGMLGAAGAILAVANLAPEDCVAAFDGDTAAQHRLHTLYGTEEARFPQGLKEATAKRFGTSAVVRLG